ncbi:MAG TPA: hypothetical protein VHQ45_05085 [Gemmatimonadaceae bacterium]|nr:hypothetical protein [Gemmatimonadaceae bacterium]
MRPLRVFLLTGAVHFVVTVLALIVAVGAAYGAHRGWPDNTFDSVVGRLADVLTGPIVLGRTLLPEAWAPGFGWFHLLLNSALWAGAITLASTWRRAHRTRRAV